MRASASLKPRAQLEGRTYREKKNSKSGKKYSNRSKKSGSNNSEEEKKEKDASESAFRGQLVEIGSSITEERLWKRTPCVIKER